MKKIFVTWNYKGYAKNIMNLGEVSVDSQDFFKNPNDYGLVLFTGGDDVSPELYNHTSPNQCMNNPKRDANEIAVFKHARKHGIRCLGICRGFQFLNVMDGGTMYHHLDNHEGTNHYVLNCFGVEMAVNSLHHQLVNLSKTSGAYSICTTINPINMSMTYYGDKDLPVKAPEREVEAAIFPGIESAGVQWHPEYLSDTIKSSQFFIGMAKRLMGEKDFKNIAAYYRDTTKKQFVFA